MTGLMRDKRRAAWTRLLLTGMSAAFLVLLAAMTVAVAVPVGPASAAAPAAADEQAEGPAAGERSGTLQQQIDRASAGAVIRIPPGTYAGPIVIDKPLTLEASPEGEVILTNTGDNSAVTVLAERVRLAGLTILDETVKDAPTVLIQASGATVENLHVVTGSHGIRLRDAHDSELRGNVVEWGAQHIREVSEKGNGIDLYNSHRVNLIGNTVKQVYDAIYLENSDDVLVEGNRIEHSRYGVHSMYSRGTVVRSNIGEMNITGAMIMMVTDAVVADNTFRKQSENVHSQGILLYDVHQTAVTGNRVVGNRVGLYVEQSANNRLEHNEVTENFIGLQLLDSSHNTIIGNRFSGNVADALTQRSADNRLHGNYWEAFSGIDADGDGYSDVSYEINPLFQSLIRNRPVFQIFFQTPGILFLETIFEGSRDEWAVDRAPLMEPPDAVTDAAGGQAGWTTGIAGLLLTALSTLIIFSFGRRSG